jgi:hypothetical protein
MWRVILYKRPVLDMAAESPKTASTRNHVELEKPEKAVAGEEAPRNAAVTGRAIETV